MIRFMMHLPVVVQARMTVLCKNPVSLLGKSLHEQISPLTQHDRMYNADCNEEYLGQAIGRELVTDVIVMTHIQEPSGIAIMGGGLGRYPPPSMHKRLGQSLRKRVGKPPNNACMYKDG